MPLSSSFERYCCTGQMPDEVVEEVERLVEQVKPFVLVGPGRKRGIDSVLIRSVCASCAAQSAPKLRASAVETGAQ